MKKSVTLAMSAVTMIASALITLGPAPAQAQQSSVECPPGQQYVEHVYCSVTLQICWIVSAGCE